MKTISTLCATSTVGIAACGLALGRPRELQEDDRFSNNSNRSTTTPSSSTGRHSISTGGYTVSPSSLSIEPPSTSASSKKAWYRRLSESLQFSSAPSSSHASSSPTSSVSASKSRHDTLPTPSPRSSTRNKLVKRSFFRAASPALFHSQSLSISTPPQQPATVSTKDPPLLSPISPQRPTTHLESGCDSDFQAYDPRPVASWKVFFTAKKHYSKSARSIKRIYPDCLHHPTLVLAHVISDEPSDTSSVYSGQSIYYDSHPTSVMPISSTLESPPSSPVQGIKIRRSFSISNILHSPRMPSRHSRRHSSAPAQHWFPQPTPYHTPSENFPPSPLPRPYTSEFQHLPPIQSVSAFNIDIEPEPFRIPLSSNDADSSSDSSSDSGRLEGDGADKNNTDNDSLLQNDSIYGPHRLSLLTNAGSERASTLIGSDDDLDRGTENVFDSVRTRVNEGVTPIRVESIFDLPPDMASSLPLKKNRSAPYVDEIDVSPTSDVYRSLTPPVKVDGWLSNRQDDTDDLNWGSDWELRNSKVEVSPRLGGIPMVARRSESSAAVLKNTLRDNGSKSSIEDWTELDGDSHSHLGSSPATARQAAATWRVKTKGKSASSKEGPNLSHSRSQSLPVRTARHMPSENWDDDFGFEEDELGLETEVVVPQAIQERQQKVLRHLDAVKEFAALVEELKRLMEVALSTGSRWGPFEKIWDEAEGVIALASTGNSDKEDESDPKEEPRGRQRDSEISAFSSLNEFSDEEEDVKLVMEEESHSSKVSIGRRPSFLLPGDDVFGGGIDTIFMEPSTKPKAPFERQSNRHLKSHSTSCTSDSRKGMALMRPDPVATARSMMERMQRGSSDSLGTNSSTISSNNGTLQFDTKMLGPLLDKVKSLLTTLESSLRDQGHFDSLSRDNLELGIQYDGA